MARYRAGIARVALDPPLGLPMMGYGARIGVANAREDPLHARALYLEAGEGALLVEADLCLVAVAQAAELRARIGARTGLAPAQILLGCIHTHSAPDTGMMQVALGREAPAAVGPLLEPIVAASVRAVETAVDARVGLASVPVSIGRNRRVADGPVDPDARVLRVDRDDGSPLAVLYVHGCHPTALGHDNLAYSADWPGEAARVIEAALPGALAIFALGPHADVDPRTRGLLDLAIPDQSVGVDASEMRALGREIGESVARCAAAIETSREGVVAASSEVLAVPALGADCEARRRDAFAVLGLAEDARPSIAEIYRLEGERARGASLEETRERLSRVRLYLRDRTAPRVAGGPRPAVEVQVLRFGPLWLLGLPLEVTVDVGREWRRCSGEHGSVVSIANGWMRYLPDRSHFDHPDARYHYEILNATLVPDASARLLACAEEQRIRLGGAP